MHCPYCKIPNTKVIDSRYSSDTNKVRRRRECEVCQKRFTTYEAIELSIPMLIKGDGSRENFDINKVKNGINKAIEKRSITAEQVDQIVYKIESWLRDQSEKEIYTSQIGELVMNALKELDQVSYVRFASVYRSFQDVSAFKDEVDKLQSIITSPKE